MHQISWGNNKTAKVDSNMQRIAYSSSFIPCKIQRELSKSGIVFAVNRYECFMVVLRKFCGCKPSKNNIEPHQNLLFLVKKRGVSGLTPRYTEYQKVKKNQDQPT